ncbi:MAG: hypothetical protein JW863_06095 [Chitinispirillaceae bacterium]|nr:hypothetical protein [Chitinispirillaceae bacterium]
MNNSRSFTDRKSVVIALLFCFFLTCSDYNSLELKFGLVVHFVSKIAELNSENIEGSLCGRLYNAPWCVNLDSASFHSCPLDNIDCDERIYYEEVTDYTTTTSMAGLYDWDNNESVDIKIILKNSDDKRETIVPGLRPSGMGNVFDFLLLFANQYCDTISEIDRFFQVCRIPGSKEHLVYESHPLQYWPGDSLYIIWLE